MVRHCVVCTDVPLRQQRVAMGGMLWGLQGSEASGLFTLLSSFFQVCVPEISGQDRLGGHLSLRVWAL